MPNGQELTGQGRLQIGAVTIDNLKPATNATVRIIRRGQDEVIQELRTDISGQTATVNLPCPAKLYSMNLTETQPYSEYDVTCDFEGYRHMLIEGVQILPDTESYQELNLEPENINTSPVVEEIPEHTLWGNYPPKELEAEVKPLPDPTGYVVLPEVVIPEYIIVHMGVPTNSSAANYWVPFVDYIKNVACCEIYANWPEETIKANVLAIISLTLNRVYTEWYRGKGYNFTITNSTAFDQAYSHGRNIFSEIANVVDDIFSTYITKPNIRQPLFAEYCDGKRVSCPTRLSQWGSKDLGDQGYSAMEILKRYYGQDIYLMNAQSVSGIPSSYPGTALQMGSSGQNVRVIQEQLNAVSNNYPAIPKVRVDGVYGNQTRQAVEAFQRIFKLSADGIVGFSTWYKLSHIYVAVTKMAELTR